MLSDGEIVFHADYAEVCLATQVNLERVLATSCLVFDDLSLQKPHVLWDCRGTQVGLTSADLRVIANYARMRRAGRSFGRAGLLVDVDVAYGLARVLQVFADNPSYEVMVFRDETQARAWVQEGIRPPES